MSMLTWAEREVELACKREAPDRKEGEWDYGCACYESALKAYKSMMEDEHSGMSWSITREILLRLMSGKPLTPIEDIPENWDHKEWHDKGEYQCNRMSSLFKHINKDGTVTYNDVNRVVVKDSVTGTTWHNGFADRLVERFFPITFPYCPKGRPYVVAVEEYLTDRRNGDFDTIYYKSILCPDGTVQEIREAYKETDDGMEKISAEELENRIRMHKEREEREAHEDTERKG